MKRKSMTAFIDEHYTELNNAINAEKYRWDGNGGRGTVPTPAPQYDRDEIRQWIANDEALYNWARREGVQV